MKEIKEQTVCSSCFNLKIALETNDSDNEALRKTTKRLGDEIRECERKYASLEKRSNDITAQMAGVLELSGNLENVNDKFANTKLSKRFQDLYDRQWTELSEWLQENVQDMTEIQQIKFITSMMKLANKECIETAENQLRQFLFLDKHEPLPSPQEDPELFKSRRMNGQKEKTRGKLKRKITKDILNTQDAYSFIQADKLNEVKGKLENFFTEFVDICWLMTISHPKMLLNFNVIGKPYCGTTKERFKQYSCQDTVSDETLPNGAIFEVVWPSVELENGEGICAKGDVITVGK
ncbi:uncharacterized protein LOC123530591 isoform X2 [Mercenaria mercenaria]|nr:uncharacterized protein LOC123530591 isoform X2 [Mercenaria mercenaria]